MLNSETVRGFSVQFALIKNLFTWMISIYICIQEGYPTPSLIVSKDSISKILLKHAMVVTMVPYTPYPPRHRIGNGKYAPKSSNK